MSEPHEIRNLYDLPAKRKTTFAKSVRAFWAPIGAVVAVAGSAVTGTVILLRPFSGKADAKSVSIVDQKVNGQYDRIDHLEQHAAAQDARLDNLEHGQAWMLTNQFQIAQQLGLHPDPLPMPRPVPSVDPRSTPMQIPPEHP